MADNDKLNETPPGSSRLEEYLHRRIPLSKAMGVTVVGAGSESVTLSAPLGPNINHRETVFGGSATALAILAAWSLVRTRLEIEGIDLRIVIQKSTMSFTAPIDGEFSATASLTKPSDWSRFVEAIRKKGKARISVTAKLKYRGETVGIFDGLFVAI